MPLAQIMKQGGVWWERKYKKTRKKRVAWHAQGHDTFLTRKYIENQIYNLIYLPILFYFIFFPKQNPILSSVSLYPNSRRKFQEKDIKPFFCVCWVLQEQPVGNPLQLEEGRNTLT